ncbi:MAG: biotin/lipoate A/B protein ligase family protein [Candidatus Methanoperedens sp.]|nr:biotin/lipoate A/B protein ligase family protein [Candidatus Methanoperedens sp.]MCZ7370116.1 biotin/lipoate A/B protein ligase family protein [Candidatus Methanoperedens sp.]
MKWRVVELETYDAYQNMALDEAVSEGIRSGSSPPTIRFYTWEPSAVSIGYFQSIRDEVNLDVCRELGVDCIRRWTGGGAVYHDHYGEITYSVIVPATVFPKNIIESYRIICGWLVKGLERVGIAAEFNPINDILAGGKKISGSAQTRRGGILLQHGTLLYDLDLATMFSVLNVSKQKITDKMIQNAEERVTCIVNHCDAGKREVYEALVEAFTQGKDWEFGGWSKIEIDRAKELASEKYRGDEWMYLR